MSAEELREISEDELRGIRELHEIWVRSGGTKGERADLYLADLQGRNLEGADLRGANLRKANLQDARLRETNFEEANLYKAKLRKADLSFACLRGAKLEKAELQGADLDRVELKDADLTRADLTGANLRNVQGLDTAKLNDIWLEGATGLLGDEFAGADITGAKLPEEIADFAALKYVETASQQARHVFLGMIGGCVYTWLTIATTTDAALLVNTAETPLPIFQTKIPIAGFYWAAPLILLGIYFYLHLYLQGLWEALARLPAIFPDGNTVDRKSYPWLLMSLARAHIPLLKQKGSALGWLRVSLSLVATWGLVPFTLLLLWVRYLPRHDGIGITLLIASLLVATWSGIFFHRLMRGTLRRDPSKHRHFPVLEVTVVSIAALVTAGVSYLTLASGTRLEILGYHLYADLAKEKIESAKLEAMDLRFAVAVAAQLGLADLERADLEGANLRGATLSGANMKSARLKGVNLKNATLINANLKFADLSPASFSGTKIIANLSGANLRDASLKGAKLQEADLTGAKLMQSNLKGVNLERAILRGACLTGTSLQGANLRHADLSGANLMDAKFGPGVVWWRYRRDIVPMDARKQAVNMLGVILKNARLQGVDLSGVQNLDTHQLNQACTDDETKAPQFMEGFLRKECTNDMPDPCPPEKPKKSEEEE